jgi:transcriptional repressor NrdR
VRCPFCGHADNKVVDSRVSKDATVIRRRRQCLDCGQRFTTYERVEELETYVIKKDGSREAYERGKVKNGILTALRKRPVSVTAVEDFLNSLEASFQENNRREIPAQEIGEAVILWLRGVDEVAYVRFASVYREFRDAREFREELDRIMANHGDST